MNGAKFPLTSDANDSGGVEDVENLAPAMRCVYFFGEEEMNGFRGK